MAKKVAVASLLILFLFGATMLILMYYQSQTAAHYLAFLKERGVTESHLKDSKKLFEKEVPPELKSHLTAGSLSKREKFIREHQKYNYWAAVCRGVSECALLVLLILGLRKLFSKIYIPAWIYRKLWSD